MLSETNLGTPRPRAWMYMSIPVGYDHAEAQWRVTLSEMSAREGYTIERAFTDHDRRSDGLVAMMTQLPYSGVGALFVPSPRHLWIDGRYDGQTRVQLQELLNRPIFVIKETDAPIIPPGSATSTTTRRRRRWRRVAS